MLDFEEQFYNEKIKVIVGVDEAGRGPLCGPVVAAACILPHTYINEKINDSKKLSEKKRERLYDEIINNALSYGVGIVDSKRIDEINIYEATKEAMHLAISQLKIDYDLILTDAMKLKDEKVDVIDIIKGDAKCQCIAAASIIAKVTRDRLLLNMDEQYPEYGFKSHKGYGTKKHVEAIKEHGIIDGFYRETYEPIKSLLLEEKIIKK
ncbi:MAG: ribonuclease HII [Candidatus Onthovivens sp.]|nr:ribonuclease HII [Candidatus Onthovivens sp.]